MAKEISPKLLSLLACPKCNGDLSHKKQANCLQCTACKLAFGVENGIPTLLVKGARKL